MNKYKYDTRDMCERKGWHNIPINTVWLLFTEEVGELASAIRQYTRTFKKTGLKKDRGVDIQMEMGDVFSYLFQMAHILNIDLDEMWERHQVKVLERKYMHTTNE
jgi:NTP pyrophosphatase (non-canonical NTP hydrolase)